MNTKYLYNALPYSLKCVLASLHGLRLKASRYGKLYQKEMADAQMREQWSSDQLFEYQNNQLKGLLQYSLKSIPWYQGYQIDVNSITVDNVRQILSILPIVEKQSIRNNPELFLDPKVPMHKLYIEHTSGTTGTPLTLWRSRSMVQRWYALAHRRWLGWSGVSTSDKWAIFGGQLVTPVRRQKPPFWVYNLPMHQLYCSAYHISVHSVAAYINKLSQFNPVYILGYPSSLNALATHGREAGIVWKGTRLKKIIGNGEFFNQYQRKNIEKYFGCQTADTYGSVEAVFLGVECQCGSMHLSPDVGFCEIVDKSGNPVDHGKSGDLVCTGFLNYAMPLIRYRTGDCLTMHQKPCACGSSFPIVESIEGRDDDIIICPDGRRVGRMSPTFKLNFPILEAQIEQTDLHTIIVRIVPLAKYTSADSEGIRKAVEERLGTGMAINVIAVDAIQRASAGKFKAVISRLE